MPPDIFVFCGFNEEATRAALMIISPLTSFHLKYTFVISFYYEEMHGKINLKGFISALDI